MVSEHMVGYGSPGTHPKFRMVAQAQGLGLLPGVIVDQHFAQRDRFGRLMNLVASSPDLLGIGLDEDTAIHVTDETDLEVVGRGSVFCVDMRTALTDAATARGTAPLMISGAVAHFLPNGARFDLTSRTLVSYRDHSAVDPGDLPEPDPQPGHGSPGGWPQRASTTQSWPATHAADAAPSSIKESP